MKRDIPFKLSAYASVAFKGNGRNSLNNREYTYLRSLCSLLLCV